MFSQFKYLFKHNTIILSWGNIISFYLFIIAIVCSLQSNEDTVDFDKRYLLLSFQALIKRDSQFIIAG